MAEYDAVVVGSGPNGLAAATTLAEAGASVLVVEGAEVAGGGCRSAEVAMPGFLADTCSAVHPLGIASPYFSTLPLERHGLEWLHPEVPLAHPLDGGDAAVLLRDLDATADALGDPRWATLLRPAVEGWDALVDAVLGPPTRWPRHPVALARFGLRAPWPAALVAKALGTERSAALFTGCAAHTVADLRTPLTTAPGLLLAAAGHVRGWPVVRGGSQRLSDALVSHLAELGGTLETGRSVADIDELPSAEVVLFDTTPWALARIARRRLGDAYARQAARFRHGAASFKLDYALDGPVPWTAEACRRAGTVHLAGTAEEVVAAERDVARGRIPEWPYVLVAQQSVVDPSRAPAGKHTLWAYCHVPFASTEDMTGRIEAQLERFAPGFGERVLARAVTSPAQLAASNPNYVGGDIAGGATDGLQVVFRPRATLRPYATTDPGIFLCSGSTPPGPGVHGMSGHEAAKAALRSLTGVVG